MNIKDDIRPISYIKSHAADVLNQVNKTRRPIVITQNGEAKAVLLDTESFMNMQKAIAMLKLSAQGESDITGKRYDDQDYYFEKLEKRIMNRKK